MRAQHAYSHTKLTCARQHNTPMKCVGTLKTNAAREEKSSACAWDSMHLVVRTPWFVLHEKKMASVVENVRSAGPT